MIDIGLALPPDPSPFTPPPVDPVPAPHDDEPKFP
jgi:hypothetical protein